MEAVRQFPGEVVVTVLYLHDAGDLGDPVVAVGHAEHACVEEEIFARCQVAVQHGECSAAPVSCRTTSPERAASWPWMRTVPASGRVRVARMRRSVVFPAPFGPKSARTSFACASRSTPRRTAFGPYDFSRPRIWTKGVSASPDSNLVQPFGNKSIVRIGPVCWR